ELGHAIEPAEARDAVEYPGELRMLGDLALVEHDVLLGIDAASDERGGDLARRLRQLGRILPYRHCMQGDDAGDAVVACVQRDELHERAEVIAEVQIAGRLDAGKHPLLDGHAGTPSIATPDGMTGGRGARGGLRAERTAGLRA